MQNRDFALQKLRYAISTTDRLIAGEWPNDEARDALSIINQEFRAQLDTLSELDASDDVVSAWCANARDLVSRYLSYIGIILRSSNIRNAFEIYNPIKRICAQLLGKEFKIVIGSEWDYTPFVYPIPIDPLDKYIFVGLPASEAQNSLLMPIAGHEIGHAVWRKKDIGNEFTKKIQELLAERIGGNQREFFGQALPVPSHASDLRFKQPWSRASSLAVRQCEEVFCDLIGCWLFGEGYLHSFCYLLSPDSATKRSDNYPTNRSRAEFLVVACKRYHDVNLEISHLFSVPQESTTGDLRHADAATKQILPDIIERVDRYCRSKRLKKPSKAGRDLAITQLKALKPALPGSCTADVVNAAWLLRLSLSTWQVPGVDDGRKPEILNELVFKSLEVDEYMRIQEHKK